MVKREYIKKILKEYVKEKKTFNILLEQSTSLPSDVKGKLTSCIPCKEFDITKEKSTVVYLKNQTKRGGFAIKVSGTNDPSITTYYFIDGSMIQNADGGTKVMDYTWDYTKCAQESVEEDDKVLDMSKATAKQLKMELTKWKNDYSRKGCASMINSFYHASELYQNGGDSVFGTKDEAANYRDKIKNCKANYDNKWWRIDGNMLDKKLDALSGFQKNNRFIVAGVGSPYYIGT